MINKSTRTRSVGHRKSQSRRAAPLTSDQKKLLGTTVEVTIERLSHDARGIAHLDGKIIFVDQALPFERHNVKITSVKANFIDSVSIALLSEKSPARVEPVCPHYETCGGCSLQHMDHPSQIAFKSNLLVSQLNRAGVNTEGVRFAPVVEESALQYRHRCRLSLQHRGVPFAGFRQRSSSSLVKIDSCVVLIERLGGLIHPLQTLLLEFRSQVLGHIELLEADNEAILVLRHVLPLNVEEKESLEHFSTQHRVNILLQPQAETKYVNLDGQAVDPDLKLAVPELPEPLLHKISDFTQVNHRVNARMIEQALAWCNPSDNEIWLDLFCGIGNFSMPLATKTKRVIGVEAVPEMVGQAKTNAERLKLENCEFLAADLEQEGVLRQLPKQIDGVLLDPPRSGAKTIIQNLLKLAPQKIVYISCDTATFSRDAKILLEGGYKMDMVGILDMFPQTMHVETMARFLRTKR